jgi:hypothetical protein
MAAMVVKAGVSVEETMKQYELTRAEVHAALAYYYDNQEAIEQSFREAETFVREVGITADDLINRMRTRLGQKQDQEK